MPSYICCICGKVKVGYGNNPEPILPYADKNGKRNLCCDNCNRFYVIPERLKHDSKGD